MKINCNEVTIQEIKQNGAYYVLNEFVLLPVTWPREPDIDSKELYNSLLKWLFWCRNIN
jgi:hypothetical protein